MGAFTRDSYVDNRVFGFGTDRSEVNLSAKWRLKNLRFNEPK
jgi:hypothetical protein